MTGGGELGGDVVERWVPGSLRGEMGLAKRLQHYCGADLGLRCVMQEAIESELVVFVLGRCLAVDVSDKWQSWSSSARLCMGGGKKHPWSSGGR